MEVDHKKDCLSKKSYKRPSKFLDTVDLFITSEDTKVNFSLSDLVANAIHEQNTEFYAKCSHCGSTEVVADSNKVYPQQAVVVTINLGAITD